MNKRKRLAPLDRHQQILTAALTVARRDGLAECSRDAIAVEAGCTPALVSHYAETMPKLRRAIVGEAIRLRDLRVIAQAIVAREPRALRLDDETKRAAAATLCE